MSKEMPILFSTPMVQAILEDRKPMTRRKLPDWASDYSSCNIVMDPELCDPDSDEIKPKQYYGLYAEFDGGEWNLKCPYGKPGDLLWVRETHYRYGKWVKNGTTKTGKQKWKFSPALIGGSGFRYQDDPPDTIIRPVNRTLGWYKRSSLFMPKTAARIWLEVTDVRVERLQDISDKDAFLEGIQTHANNGSKDDGTARGCFKSLWESINGDGSWDANPWVWVVRFKVISKTGKP